MNIIIKEIKAYCNSPQRIEAYLIQHKADYRGIDKQEDTYYKVDKGRLKLRIGNKENNLISYHRKEFAGMKHSKVNLFPVEENVDALRDTLAASHDVLVVVKKERKIFFIDNVKFHLDKVDGLGTFVEIEAIGENGSYSEEELTKQCQFYINEFEIKNEDMIAKSYSDMILDKKKEVRSNQRTS